MPELRRFDGFKVQMFFADHPPIHVHVEGNGFRARVRVSDGAIISGDLPANIRREVSNWILENRGALVARWQRYGGA